jgi:hypothetical protein
MVDQGLRPEMLRRMTPPENDTKRSSFPRIETKSVLFRPFCLTSDPLCGQSMRLWTGAICRPVAAAPQTVPALTAGRARRMFPP